MGGYNEKDTIFNPLVPLVFSCMGTQDRPQRAL